MEMCFRFGDEIHIQNHEDNQASHMIVYTSWHSEIEKQLYHLAKKQTKKQFFIVTNTKTRVLTDHAMHITIQLHI